MSPMPCAHCAMNFMRTDLDPDSPKLCNNCLIREDLRNPKKETPMDMIEILIKCPKEINADIEEHCIKIGKSFSDYFIDLHKSNTQEDWRSKTEMTHSLPQEPEEYQNMKNVLKKEKSNKKS